MKINWFKINFFGIEDIILRLVRDANRYEYLSFLIFLKQGFYCKDCGLGYDKCDCEEYILNFSIEKIIDNICFILFKILSKSKIKEFISDFRTAKNEYEKVLIYKSNIRDEQAVKNIKHFLEKLTL